MTAPPTRDPLFAALRSLTVAERAMRQARIDLSFVLRDPIARDEPAVPISGPPAAVPTGDELAERRKRLGLTQEDLAALTDVSRPMIAAVESRNYVKGKSTRRYLGVMLERLEAMER